MTAERRRHAAARSRQDRQFPLRAMRPPHRRGVSSVAGATVTSPNQRRGRMPSMRRNFDKVTRDGVPVIWLGANFWSRAGGPLMWRNYDPAVVRAELAVL